MRQYLERQADTIEAVLAEHGVAGEVTGGSLSPRLIQYRLGLPDGVRPARLSPVLPAVAARLDVRAVRLAPDPAGRGAILEIPRPDPAPVSLLPLARSVVDVVPPATATLGVDTDGTPLLLRVDAPEVGTVLVCGERGAGKSALLRSMALSLALHNGPDALRMLLIDLTGTGRRAPGGTWAGMADLPHLVAEPAYDSREARLRLAWATRIVRRRVQMVLEGETLLDENLILFVDGLAAALAGPDGRAIDEALTELTANGPEVGVHVVAAGLPGPALEAHSWGVRVVGRCKDAVRAHRAAGLRGTGAEGLLGDGDFLVLLGGEVTRFQAAWVGPDEMDRTVALLATCAAGEELPVVMQPARPARGPLARLRARA